MTQLTLTLIPPQPLPDRSLFYARTLLDAKRFISGDFNPDHFCATALDESPFLSLHNIYADAKLFNYIGIIFRYTPRSPFQYAPVGYVGETRKEEDFDRAVALLLQWRAEIEGADRQLMLEWRSGKVL